MKNVIEEGFLAEINLPNHHTTANDSATSRISVIEVDILMASTLLTLTNKMHNCFFWDTCAALWVHLLSMSYTERVPGTRLHM